jgi:hypothetical protein
MKDLEQRAEDFVAGIQVARTATTGRYDDPSDFVIAAWVGYIFQDINPETDIPPSKELLEEVVTAFSKALEKY